ncbi:MAG: SIR2 family protein [Saonia sp.]
MKKLLVVLGAGASIDFGMPRVTDVDELFEKLASQHFPIIENRTSVNDNLYNWVKSNFNKYELKNLNYEDMMFKIQSIASLSKNHKICFGNDSDYVLPKVFPKIRSYYHYETIANSNELIKMNAVLNHGLLTTIREKSKNLQTEKEVELKRIKQFFNYLSQDFEIGFVNLNHDNVLLSAMPELKTGFDKDTGKFNSEIFYNNEWNFCYHIHGSIHFNMEDENIMWKEDLNGKFGLGAPNRRSFDTEEGATHPMSTIITGKDKINQIYREPFRQYFLSLDKKIYESDTILFIGYGFNDSYLNELLRTHSLDKSKRRNIVVIDYQEEALRSLSEGGSEWGVKLLSTAATPFYQMGNGSTNTDYRPDKVDEYKRTRTFEFSDSYDNPLYVWYSGFLDACENKEKVKKALDGYVYEPNGCLSKTRTGYH